MNIHFHNLVLCLACFSALSENLFLFSLFFLTINSCHLFRNHNLNFFYFFFTPGPKVFEVTAKESGLTFAKECEEK